MTWHISPALRARALQRGIDAFDQWRVRQKPLLARLELDAAGQTVTVYGANLKKTSDPLILGMGGILSLKEQWHRLLLAARRIGCRVAVLDFPGAGGSELIYRAQSAADMGMVVEALLRQTGAKECIVVASGFAGTVFLKLALANPAIRSSILNDSPLYHFFTDPAWWVRVPQIIKLGMAACMKLSLADMEQHRTDWAIGPADLARLSIPVVYIASLRNEIIPPADRELLAKQVPAVEVVSVNDNHATSDRSSQAGLEMMWRLLGFAGKRQGLYGASVRLARFFANLSAARR